MHLRAALTTAFTCRAGCKERHVSKNRHASPVKCNALFARLLFPKSESSSAHSISSLARDSSNGPNSSYELESPIRVFPIYRPPFQAFTTSTQFWPKTRMACLGCGAVSRRLTKCNQLANHPQTSRNPVVPTRRCNEKRFRLESLLFFILLGSAIAGAIRSGPRDRSA